MRAFLMSLNFMPKMVKKYDLLNLLKVAMRSDIPNHSPLRAVKLPCPAAIPLCPDLDLPIG